MRESLTYRFIQSQGEDKHFVFTIYQLSYRTYEYELILKLKKKYNFMSITIHCQIMYWIYFAAGP